MHYQYRLLITNPLADEGVKPFPPQIQDSEWFTTFDQSLNGISPKMEQFANPNLAIKRKTLSLTMTFASKEALDGWLATHKLTDSTLLTYTELIDEIPTYTPENGHIFG